MPLFLFQKIKLSELAVQQDGHFFRPNIIFKLLVTSSFAKKPNLTFEVSLDSTYVGKPEHLATSCKGISG
jgi:hypothetical protein